jgi:hypothetical protein
MTMASYGMQGTPTLILIDRWGRLRKHSFGVEDDMRVGADIAFLLAEREEGERRAGDIAAPPGPQAFIRDR